MLIPIEIKSAMTFNQEFANGIAKFQKISSSAQNGYVIYAGELTPDLSCARVMNFAHTDEIFR